MFRIIDVGEGRHNSLDIHTIAFDWKTPGV